MDIQEIQAAKAALEIKFAEEIMAFSQQTGTAPTDLSLDAVVTQRMDGSKEISGLGVKLTVEL